MGEDMIRLAGDASLRTQFGEQSLRKILDFDAALQIERLRDFINERTAAVSGSQSRRAA